MKKLKKVIICIAVALVLVIPVVSHADDGGSVRYSAILYTVDNVHRINPDIEDDYFEGIIVRVFGVEVFNNVK